MRKSLFMLCVSLSVFVYSQENDSINPKNAFLLFEVGAVYPEIEFKDDSGEKQLGNNAFNVSNNRFSLGFGGDLASQLGYILTLRIPVMIYAPYTMVVCPIPSTL